MAPSGYESILLCLHLVQLADTPRHAEANACDSGNDNEHRISADPEKCRRTEICRYAQNAESCFPALKCFVFPSAHLRRFDIVGVCRYIVSISEFSLCFIHLSPFVEVCINDVVMEYISQSCEQACRPFYQHRQYGLVLLLVLLICQASSSSQYQPLLPPSSALLYAFPASNSLASHYRALS